MPGSRLALSPEERKARKVARDKAYRATPKAKARQAANDRLRKYGVTSEWFAETLSNQGFTCGICGSDTHRSRNWCVDHCHHTDRVRGILCGPCNSGIGGLKDSPELLWRSLKYLRSHGSALTTEELLELLENP